MIFKVALQLRWNYSARKVFQFSFLISQLKTLKISRWVESHSTYLCTVYINKSRATIIKSKKNYCITMTESEGTLNDETDDKQLIRLCLKKPKQWNWELTTSKSSSLIAFPTIRLYDENNETLLAEATDAGFVASSKSQKSAPVSKASSLASKNSFKMSIRNDSIEEIFVEPLISSPTESPAPTISRRSSKESQKCNEKQRTKIRSRSSSSTSMRSRSSVSILHRISERRGSSSEGSDVEKTDEKQKQKQKYSFRSYGKLGTIVVPKESFTNVRRRPQRINDDAGESDLLLNLQWVDLFLNALIF